jgi:hypothetical protein
MTFFSRAGWAGAEGQKQRRLNEQERRREQRFARQTAAIDWIQNNTPGLQRELDDIAKLKQYRLNDLVSANAAAQQAQQTQQAQQASAPSRYPRPSQRSEPRPGLPRPSVRSAPVASPPVPALPALTAANPQGTAVMPFRSDSTAAPVSVARPSPPPVQLPVSPQGETVTLTAPGAEAQEFIGVGLDTDGVNPGGGAALSADPGEQERLARLEAITVNWAPPADPSPLSPPADPSPLSPRTETPFYRDVANLLRYSYFKGSGPGEAFDRVVPRAGPLVVAKINQHWENLKNYFTGDVATDAQVRAANAEEFEQARQSYTDAVIALQAGEPEPEPTTSVASGSPVAPQDFATLGATGTRRTGGARTATPKNVNSATPGQIAKTKPGDMIKALRAVNVREPAAVRNAVRAAEVLAKVSKMQLSILANTVTYENVDQIGPAMAAIYGDVAQRSVELEQGLLGAYTDAALRAGDPVGTARFLSDALGYDVQIMPSGDGFQIMVNGQVEGTYGSKGKLMQRLKTMADPAFGGQVSAMQQKMALEDLKFQRQMQLKQMEIQGRIRAAGISASGGGRPKSSSVTEMETGIPGVIRVQARDPVTNATRGDTLIVNPGARWPNGEPIPIGNYDLGTFEAMMREQQ